MPATKLVVPKPVSLRERPDLSKRWVEDQLDVMGYEQKWHEYTLRVTAKDFQAHSSLLADIIKRAYDYANAD